MKNEIFYITSCLAILLFSCSSIEPNIKVINESEIVFAIHYIEEEAFYNHFPKTSKGVYQQLLKHEFVVRIAVRNDSKIDTVYFHRNHENHASFDSIWIANMDREKDTLLHETLIYNKKALEDYTFDLILPGQESEYWSFINFHREIDTASIVMKQLIKRQRFMNLTHTLQFNKVKEKFYATFKGTYIDSVNISMELIKELERVKKLTPNKYNL